VSGYPGDKANFLARGGILPGSKRFALGEPSPDGSVFEPGALPTGPGGECRRGLPAFASSGEIAIYAKPCEIRFEIPSCAAGVLPTPGPG